MCQDDGFFELAGLVSWGFGCGRQDVPGNFKKMFRFSHTNYFKNNSRCLRKSVFLHRLDKSDHKCE